MPSSVLALALLVLPALALCAPEPGLSRYAAPVSNATKRGTWTLEPLPSWPPRYNAALVQHGGGLVLLGGRGALGPLSDAWRTYGNALDSWHLVTLKAPWEKRMGLAAVAVPDPGDDGLSDGPGSGAGSSGSGGGHTDGGSASGSGSGSGSGTRSSGDIVIMGGFNDRHLSTEFFADVWLSSDGGMSWTLRNPRAVWGPRQTEAVVIDGGATIVIVGGNGYDGAHDDVWRSEDRGATWTLVCKHAAFSPRAGHAAALFRGQLWVVGGQDPGRLIAFNDAWSSADGGATWTQQTASAAFSARSFGAVAVFPAKSSGAPTPEERMVLLGGTNFFNPVCPLLNCSCFGEAWSTTDGQTWSRLDTDTGTTYPWYSRAGAMATVFQGQLTMISGQRACSAEPLHDVWVLDTGNHGRGDGFNDVYWLKTLGGIAAGVVFFVCVLKGGSLWCTQHKKRKEWKHATRELADTLVSANAPLMRESSTMGIMGTPEDAYLCMPLPADMVRMQSLRQVDEDDGTGSVDSSESASGTRSPFLDSGSVGSAARLAEFASDGWGGEFDRERAGTDASGFMSEGYAVAAPRTSFSAEMAGASGAGYHAPTPPTPPPPLGPPMLAGADSILGRGGGGGGAFPSVPESSSLHDVDGGAGGYAVAFESAIDHGPAGDAGGIGLTAMPPRAPTLLSQLSAESTASAASYGGAARDRYPSIASATAEVYPPPPPSAGGDGEGDAGGDADAEGGLPEDAEYMRVVSVAADPAAYYGAVTEEQFAEAAAAGASAVVAAMDSAVKGMVDVGAVGSGAAAAAAAPATATSATAAATAAAGAGASDAAGPSAAAPLGRASSAPEMAVYGAALGEAVSPRAVSSPPVSPQRPGSGGGVLSPTSAASASVVSPTAAGPTRLTQTLEEALASVPRVARAASDGGGTPRHFSVAGAGPTTASARGSTSIKRLWYANLDVREDEKLGVGNYGAVFKGRYHGAAVAVKQLHVEEVDADTLLEEAAVMAHVSGHPHVIAFYGVCLSPPCLVTEFAARGSVEDLLITQRRPRGAKWRAPPRVGLAETARLAWEASTGILHLHEEGIVHRDIATRNLLLDEGWHVKVTDFGLSRALSPGSGAATSMVTTGPLRWWPPELIMPKAGATTYSRKSDTFMFGVCLWEMLCRRVPYANLSARDAALKVCLEGLRPAVPAAIEEVAGPMVSVMRRCWAADPHKRPDMEVVCSELHAYHEAKQHERRAALAREQSGLSRAASDPEPAGVASQRSRSRWPSRHKGRA